MSRYIVYCCLDITDKDTQGWNDLDETIDENLVRNFVGCKLSRFTSYYQIGHVTKEEAK